VAGAKHASLNTGLSTRGRPTSGDCKSSTTYQPAKFHSLSGSDRRREEHRDEDLSCHGFLSFRERLGLGNESPKTLLWMITQMVNTADGII